jgi:hypothetical protein
MPRAAITPEDAKAVLKEIGTTTIAELARELNRRGTPVTVQTLRGWKKRKWRSRASQFKERTQAQIGVDEAIAVVGRIGMPLDELKALYTLLKGKPDGELVVEATRTLLAVSDVILEQVLHASDYLLKTDPRGLAANLAACFHMMEGGHEMMREARRLAAMSGRGDIDPQTIDVTPSSPAAAEPAAPAPPRVIPVGNLARELRLIVNTPDPVAEVIPPRTNGNGHAN